MQQFIMVTHQGPCVVTQNVYKEIVDLKGYDRKFGDQILLALKIVQREKLDIHVVIGSLPVIGSFMAFHQKFIMEDPPQRRNIII